PSSISGSVFVDGNNNGQRDPGEAGVAGVTVTLTGTDDRDVSVARTLVTADDGNYRFDQLRPGHYDVHKSQPPNLNDGVAAPGSVGGVAGFSVISGVAIDGATDGVHYTFPEKPVKKPLLVPDMSSTGSKKDREAADTLAAEALAALSNQANADDATLA